MYEAAARLRALLDVARPELANVVLLAAGELEVATGKAGCGLEYGATAVAARTGGEAQAAARAWMRAGEQVCSG